MSRFDPITGPRFVHLCARQEIPASNHVARLVAHLWSQAGYPALAIPKPSYPRLKKTLQEQQQAGMASPQILVLLHQAPQTMTSNPDRDLARALAALGDCCHERSSVFLMDYPRVSEQLQHLPHILSVPEHCLALRSRFTTSQQQAEMSQTVARFIFDEVRQQEWHWQTQQMLAETSATHRPRARM